jgi:hypothetical protein
MIIDQKFEDNLMPKLLAGYKDAREKDESQYCLDDKKAYRIQQIPR